MVTSILVLVVSTALFFFYLQTICEKALRYEFSRPYFKEVSRAVHLEHPQLRDALASEGLVDYASACLALKCDFITLEYLLKNGDRDHRHLSRREKILVTYFRVLLYSLPVRHALNLHEKQAMLKLASILQSLANSVGEKLSIEPIEAAQAAVNS
jgi:hypothetical protein